MSFVTERERRQTAGNRLKRLLEQQDDQEDEFYGTAYGGFVDEAEDNDYDSEDSEEDVVDSDFDQDVENNEDDGGEEDNDKEKKGSNNDVDDEGALRKRKKVVYQAQSLQQELRVKKKEDEESKVNREKHKKSPETKIEAKTLRTSTSVKRVELEKRQKERQERRAYLKDVASLRNTREVRRLTQEELLEEAKLTEEINLASLEAYQQIELKKKEVKRMKMVQDCPRICTSSITMMYEPKPNDNEQWNDLLDESVQFPSANERCSRTFLSFTHSQTFQEAFASWNNSSQRRPRRRLCPITDLPAQYFDPLTQMPYANLEAFQILRRIYAEELKKQKRTPSMLIDTQRDVNLNNLR